MFDAIARRYDFLNHLLSAGLDRRWRRRAIDTLHLRGDEVVLDLCTGTADLAIEAVRRKKGARRAVGIDFASAMLRLGREKVHRTSASVSLVQGDATEIPLAAESVDAVTMAFGIRNVEDPDAACREMLRCLRPGGQLRILEFGVPAIPGVRAAFLWYFRRVLPRIGRLISRHHSAYAYLPASVSTFPSPDEFASGLERAGFVRVGVDRVTLGVVYLYRARKREPERHGNEAWPQTAEVRGRSNEAS
ncbi:MAG: bifunctional demethylmenaquinone methyltransferase/2-methoxy-6-polyprenyl-1,4-benzoquinol methylase UbiE [Acidobacteria bacterium]|nr:bifunctional demethylmenaquinone methyltransferase/2-methoxy-6-polyprenyl-1,4-benzoquinol methylase UbiE [Acidobacteriota bacterium]